MLGDRQGLHVRSTFQVAMRALGGIIWYLQRCLIDKELISMRKFALFQPPDENIELKETSTLKQQNMVIERQLDVLCTSNIGLIHARSSMQRLCTTWKFYPIVEVVKKVLCCTRVIDVRPILANVSWPDGYRLHCAM